MARLARKYASEHEIRSGHSENRREEVHIPHAVLKVPSARLDYDSERC